MSARSRLGVLLAALALSAGAAWFLSRRSAEEGGPRPDGPARASTEPAAGTSSPTGSAASTSAAFVGSASCSGCHAAQAQLYQGSHHQLALRPVEARDQQRFTTPPRTELGGAVEAVAGAPSSVHLSGLVAGQVQDVEARLAYVAGVAPLEQYVLDVGRGKL
ncbi:MAG TPA: hypothetical protein VLC09_14005, partial [Polyangiaceae bacterium]|nr:hypothetical protein [Polyangiaceae bacterium]